MDCIGCKIANGTLPGVNIIYENEHIACVLDIDPFNEGHTLILPKKHYHDLEEMDVATLDAITKASVTVSRLLKQLYEPDGITICQNGGAFNDLTHYHAHVIPRYQNDGFAWSEPIMDHQASTRLTVTRSQLASFLTKKITHVNWSRKNEITDGLLQKANMLTEAAMAGGLEAEVVRISVDESSYVLKVWNKTSRPNVERQFKLLEALSRDGLAVSQPVNWGRDTDGHSVLLTSDDGKPVRKLNKAVLTKLAAILTNIHNFAIDELENDLLPSYDFISYFYPQLEAHSDIRQQLVDLVERSGMKQDRLIHGDYNLGNILVDQHGEYRIIDWTNGQLGDPRYDIAWSVVLIRIFAGHRNAALYQAAFVSQGHYDVEELELFQAIAALRLILLHRLEGIIRKKEAITRMREFLKESKYLSEDLI